ncbi:MAG: NADH-quinone oxidoreductase subunit L [Phycisphaerae bacterium]
MESSTPMSLFATLPFWPLLGAIITGVMIALRRSADRAHWPVVLGTSVSALLGIALFFHLGHPSAAEPAPETSPAMTAMHAPGDEPAAEAHADPTYHVFNWISMGDEGRLTHGRWIEVNFYFDGLTGIMLLYVTIVSLMVIIYAIGYMRDHHGHPEPGYERFFAFLGLFVFSMCALVMAGNFVLLYLGWEAVGLCSYLLIGFYYKRPSAAAAAKKAFLVNRIGDFGFALGIFSLYLFLRPLVGPHENPLDYAVVFHHIGSLAPWQMTTVALLLLCGAVGKSAQFPLYVWLPDAMEGPTPVSALIHAATMVTAGIYMVARCGPIFAHSPAALTVIVWLGAIGAVLAATMAMAQYDMKRILAYSTISQLAYMFVALGCSAPDAAVFHVFTHAFFKALLFLCAGSVMHAMGGIIDVRYFSGLRHFLPWTYRLMLVGCLALSGFPLLSGFWSKDAIVHAAFNWHWVLGVILLVTAGLTAFYTFRMFFLCFHGEKRLPPEAGEHPHESPPVMIAPLVVLALGAIFVGYLGVWTGPSLGHTFFFLVPHGHFQHYLHASTIVTHDAAAGMPGMMYLSAIVGLLGIFVAWRLYGTAPQKEPAEALGGLFRLWHAKWYVDELYDRVFVRPLRGLGHVCFGVDRFGLDGLVWLVSAVPRGLGAGLRAGQQGAVQGYALCMLIGLAVLLLIWKFVEPVIAG